jgi:hypothetical protein
VEDCALLGHVSCFEGCAPLLMYSRLQTVLITDDSAPTITRCRVSTDRVRNIQVYRSPRVE